MSKMILGSATAIALLGLCGAGAGFGPAMAAPGDSIAAGDMSLLPRAIMGIERGTGGRVLEIRQSDRGGPGFDAVVATGDGISRVNIHAPFDGATTISETERPAWMHEWELRADRRSIMQTRIPLAEAVRKAEDMTREPAVGAELAAPLTAGNAVLAYSVETMRDGSAERVAIDAKSGEGIANPDALFKTWSPERLTAAPAR